MGMIVVVIDINTKYIVYISMVVVSWAAHSSVSFVIKVT